MQGEIESLKKRQTACALSCSRRRRRDPRKRVTCCACLAGLFPDLRPSRSTVGLSPTRRARRPPPPLDSAKNNRPHLARSRGGVRKERGRKESRQSAVVDYGSDIVYRHWKLSRLMAWIVGRKGGRRGGGIVESTGFERRGRGGKMTGAFPGSRKLVLTRLCRCLMRFTLSSRAQML